MNMSCGSDYTDRQYCCTCKWYAEFEGVCCNADSEWTADFRCLDDTCPEWTSMEDNNNGIRK